MAKNVLQVHDFARALVAEGILDEKDLNNITRIIIDADASLGTLNFHIIRIGDDPKKILNSLKEMKILDDLREHSSDD